MKRTSFLPDPLLLLLALAVTGLGLFFIFDAGYARSLGDGHGALPAEFKNQLLFLGPAILAGAFCSRLKPELWRKVAPGLWYATLVFLLLVAEVGSVKNGARRWIGYGAFTIQPAEFAKMAVILYLAAILSSRKPWPTHIKPRNDFPHWFRTIAKPKLARSVPGLLVLVSFVLIDKEPDLGTAAVVAVCAFGLFVIGGISTKSLVVAVAIGSVGCVAFAKSDAYRWERIINHSHRWDSENVDDTSYQTVQSELAMASGGVGGVGIGNGRAKEVLPATTTDFIMATIAEEFGATGALVVIALLAAIVGRLYWLASKITWSFGRLILFGTGTWIGVQTCVNVMMANGFLPAIGIPLPFISSGGSSLIALWCAIGVCQSVVASPVPGTAAAPVQRIRRAIVETQRIKVAS